MLGIAYRPYLVLLGTPLVGRSCARIPSLAVWCYGTSKAVVRRHYVNIGFSVSGVLSQGQHDAIVWSDSAPADLCKRFRISSAALLLALRAHSFEQYVKLHSVRHISA